jgi:tRNA(Ile)-lysidine synthase TilS/MesJ
MQLGLRDLYETFTRDIRFLTYHNVAKIIKSENCNVYLGHNKDDKFENILTNIVSESLYSNLNGMEFESSQKFKNDTITFVRPMLNIIKSDIFAFANYCQIPHFIDSTPQWSQRGKIRDSVRPAIESWNPKAIESFFGLSNVLTELTKILDSTADLYLNKIKTENKLKINIKYKLLEKILFKTIFTKLGYSVSHKGLESFYEKIKFIKDNFDKYNINAKNLYQLNKEIKLEWNKINDEEFIILF